MSFPRSASVTATTDASGDATVYTEAIRGTLVGVTYTKTDFANGVDFTITTETTLRNVWVDTDVNASESVYPRSQVQDSAGANIAGVYDSIRCINERIKVVVAQGGNTKTGTFTVVYE